MRGGAPTRRERGLWSMCRLAAFIGDLRAAPGELHAFRQLAVRNPDGYGVGGFIDGAATIRKSAMSALDDPDFGLEPFADGARSAIVHLRKATVGNVSASNTHPFDMGDRIIAHNGTVADVGGLEALIGAAGMRRMGVVGDTDSERLAAYLALLSERAGGDTVAGYRLLARELAERQPMTSLTSLTVASNGDVFALRYPENRSLFWKRLGVRDAAAGHRALDGGGRGEATVLASRPMGVRDGWNELMPGQVLHVRAHDLSEEVTTIARVEPRLRLVDRHVDEGARWTGPRRSRMVEADLSA